MDPLPEQTPTHIPFTPAGSGGGKLEEGISETLDASKQPQPSAPVPASDGGDSMSTDSVSDNSAAGNATISNDSDPSDAHADTIKSAAISDFPTMDVPKHASVTVQPECGIGTTCTDDVSEALVMDNKSQSSTHNLAGAAMEMSPTIDVTSSSVATKETPPSNAALPAAVINTGDSAAISDVAKEDDDPPRSLILQDYAADTMLRDGDSGASKTHMSRGQSTVDPQDVDQDTNLPEDIFDGLPDVIGSGEAAKADLDVHCDHMTEQQITDRTETATVSEKYFEDASMEVPAAAKNPEELSYATAHLQQSTAIASQTPAESDFELSDCDIGNALADSDSNENAAMEKAVDVDTVEQSTEIPDITEHQIDKTTASTNFAQDDADLYQTMICQLPQMKAMQQVQQAALSSASKAKKRRLVTDELSSLQSKRASKKRSRMNDDAEDDASDDDIMGTWWKAHFSELDRPGEKAQDEFRVAAERYHKRQKKNQVSKEEEIQHMQLCQNELTRRNKVRKDWALERSENSFVGREDKLADDAVNDSFDLFVPQSIKYSRNRSPADDSSIAVVDSDCEIPDTCSINSDEGSAPQPAKTNRKKQGTKRASASQRKKRTVTSKRQNERAGPTMANISSLITSNPIRDAQYLEDGEEDEGRLRLTNRNRDKALKGLIASLPQEHQDLAKADKIALHKAATNFNGKGMCRVAKDGGWLVKGMKSSLRHFQMLGVSWMRNRENGSMRPRGGLVADEMGLGKTIMMLANIVNGIAPLNTTRECRATLIVVPSSLMNQWFNEIEKHTDLKLHGTVVKYRTSGNLGLQTSNDRQILCKAFIVLCTQHEVMKSCKKIVFPKHLQTAEEKDQWLNENRQKFRGLLHRINWLRVIVDEAHCLKNHLTHTSLAMREIDASYRWLITGTPLQNSTKELYPYFKFLDVPGTGDFRTFCNNYDPRKSSGNKRLCSMLNSVMLRRTYDDKLLGEALVKLPRTSTAEVWVEFNPVEKFVYNILKQRIQEVVTNMARKGSLARLTHYHVLTMLLRLRQASSHLLLVEQSMRDLFTKADLDELQKLSNEYQRPQDQRDRDSLLELRQLLKNHEKWKAATNEASNLVDSINTDFEQKQLRSQSTGEAYGLVYDFRCFLTRLKEGSRYEELHEALRCAKCSVEPANEAVLTNCQHVYCKKCLEALGVQACAEGLPITCLTCHKEYKSSKPFDTNKSFNEQESLVRASEGEGRVRRSRQSSKEVVELLINDSGRVQLPSTKTRAVKGQILNWLDEDQDIKGIIFTQFLPVVGYLVKMCQAEGWPCLTFNGGMSMEARDSAINKFETCKGPCILIATLRTGGVGLNLTMATKVMIVDPWWNSSAEMQAFGRVFRIGQKEKTSLVRVFAKDSIDEKIYKMQEDKNEAIRKVMGEGGEWSAKPSLDELMELFGLVDGKPDKDDEFVLADDKKYDRRKTIMEDDAYLQWNKADGEKNNRWRH